MSYNLSPDAEKLARWLFEKYQAGKLRKGFSCMMVPPRSSSRREDTSLTDLETRERLEKEDFITESTITMLIQEGLLYKTPNQNQHTIRRKLLDMFTEGVTSPAGEFQVQVWTLINEHFNMEELQDLAFELQLDWDNLEGTTKKGKARDLVKAMMRSQRSVDLINQLRRERSHVEWPEPTTD
jgi:hypothetical protein